MKSKSVVRVFHPGTFGDPLQFATLPGICNMLNNLTDNKLRNRCAIAINRVNHLVKSCNEIQDANFRLYVKRILSKQMREEIDQLTVEDDLKNHIQNYRHAKFQIREDSEIILKQQKEKMIQQIKYSAIEYISQNPPKFNIFGSKSSQDYDVLVFTNMMGSIARNAEYCKKYEYYLEDLFQREGWPAKKINVNLAFVNDGSIINVHKGTYDEVNNSLLITYQHHIQLHPLQVKYPYTRGGADNEFTHLKVKRCLRFLISFFSRIEELRPFIKPALKGNVDQRLDALRKINLTRHTEFQGKKEKPEDIYKVIAFQLAQTMCLIHGIEIYSKEQAIEHCPEFTNALLRKPLTKEDLEALQDSLETLIVSTVNLKVKMKSLDEPIFNS